jgi:hypothetical protein
MAINESISMLVDETLRTIAMSDLTIVLKFLAILGILYVFSLLFKVTLDVFDFFVHLIATIKWLINKIKNKGEAK